MKALNSILLVSLLVISFLLSGCTYPFHCGGSTWFRSCGPVYLDWGVESTIRDGMMIVTIERLPPGQYEISACRNGLTGQEILATATISVTHQPSTRVEVSLETIPGPIMTRDAFVIVKRKDRPWT